MIWLNHPQYTHEYVSAQFQRIERNRRRENRKMIFAALAAVTLMAGMQITCLYALLSA